MSKFILFTHGFSVKHNVWNDYSRTSSYSFIRSTPLKGWGLRTTHSKSRDRQTVGQIHLRNALPSRSTLFIYQKGFCCVKRAQAAQGFSHRADKFPFTDRQRKGRHNLFSEALTWTPVAQCC